MKVQPQENLVPKTNGLLSEAAAAKYIGVCRLTLMRMRQRRELGHYCVGTRIFYDIEEHIRPFLRAHEKRAKRLGGRPHIDRMTRKKNGIVIPCSKPLVFERNCT